MICIKCGNKFLQKQKQDIVCTDCYKDHMGKTSAIDCTSIIEREDVIKYQEMISREIQAVDILLSGGEYSQLLKALNTDSPYKVNRFYTKIRQATMHKRVVEKESPKSEKVKEPIDTSKIIGIWPENLYQAVFGDNNEIQIPCDYNEAIEHLFTMISAYQREVILKRFKEGSTLEEVGRQLGITRERVRQIQVKAINRLKHPAMNKYLINGFSHQNKLDEDMRQRHKIEQEELAAALLKQNEADERFRAEQAASEEDKRQRLRDITIEELDLSVRSWNGLRRAGILTLADLCKMDEKELFKVKNIGRASCQEIIQKCKIYGVEIKEMEDIEHNVLLRSKRL